MSKIKNKYFDDINTGMEKARLERFLNQYPTQIDFSPVLLAKEVYGHFDLSKKDIVEVIRNYYNF